MRRLSRSDPEPVFVEGLVLVKEGQNQQFYRACANLVCTNTRIAAPVHPVAEACSTIDAL